MIKIIMKSLVFIDAEVESKTGKLQDLGAIKGDGSQFHSNSQTAFSDFIAGCLFVGNHNIYAHDWQYIQHMVTDIDFVSLIDTLCLSPLLFPSKPYHALIKDYKLQSDERNNPLLDAINAKKVFDDEIGAFEQLSAGLKQIYYGLLYDQPQFSGFFKYLEYKTDIEVEEIIKQEFAGKICGNADIQGFVKNHPVELAYSLALVSATDRYSITPPWVLKNFPIVHNIMKLLRNTACDEKCKYCQRVFDIHAKLHDYFSYDSFRTYNDEPLQEQATRAAVENRSLLAIFPTGGGKSLAFQLPALIAGETVRGLTVVISPLQALMKDQVDNLSAKGITDAVMINGLLSPLERAEAIERVSDGQASILYIAPESLRSKTIEKLLMSRNVVRFVIDEAHCFSAWGQDFRVDYLYIGEFIKNLQENKKQTDKISISCFTATAKQKVVSDIREYFKQTLDIDLELYTTAAARSNLRYEVLYKENDKEKYAMLRDLISQRTCPAIVYVSSRRKTIDIAEKLTADGIPAHPFHGKMDSGEKVINQEAFKTGEVRAIVATSAFGMGVDKDDVGLVVHYDISDSLENYVQEAGRAGRDESLQAECYVLFNDNDLDKYFIRLNQTKISFHEINQIWKAIKDLAGPRKRICYSPLEIARQAGWNDNGGEEIETRVKTAVAALENAGYIKRGMNMPRVFADSIHAKSMIEARTAIDNSQRFAGTQKLNAIRIIERMFSERSIAKANSDEAETRVDYIADILGIPREEVIAAINLLREEGLLADSKDLTAYIRRTEKQNKSLDILHRFARLEQFMLSIIDDEEQSRNLKEINEEAEKEGVKGVSVKAIKSLLYYWTIKGYIEKTPNNFENNIGFVPQMSIDIFKSKMEKHVNLAEFIVTYLFELSKATENPASEEELVKFSVLELKEAYAKKPYMLFDTENTAISEVEDALLYLSKIGSLNLEGGFLVLYNPMEILRLELNNRVPYKTKDYEQLGEYYKQKIQQIHIVGEYAHMMVKDYDTALAFVGDYFQMDYKKFVAKYFSDEQKKQIERNITPGKYEQIYGGLSDIQKRIIEDENSQYIVVAAGPGSGKTRVLVHKLASLLIMEDVKHEQLLMLTFSRAAATEFRTRLAEIIGGAVNSVEIKTFHSYCFDLLGKKAPDKKGAKDTKEEEDVLRKIVETAVRMINDGEVEPNRITKKVVVIDEAQDMDASEYALVEMLIANNEDMRVIAVGDDDQNIYEWRGSNSKYMKSLIDDRGAVKYELLHNYRSKKNIIEFANAFVSTITERLKSAPIMPVDMENGVVTLTKHTGRNMEIPLLENIKATYKNGSACVLTNENADAMFITGLLNKSGFKARLIQNNDDFDLNNLAEFRYFFQQIDKLTAENTPTISNEIWEQAKGRLQSIYSNSKCLDTCISLLDAFASSFEQKYKNDLKIFIRESRLEDFMDIEQGEIVVSTIHKAKGREFDNVYMMLSRANDDSDAEKRVVYVAMTRAKSELYIHYNNGCFDNFTVDGTEKQIDNKQYPEPDERIEQLTLRDVHLDFFKGKKKIILNMKSGLPLNVKGDYLTDKDGHKLLHFSTSFRDKIREYAEKDYIPHKAKIRFIVAWQGKDDLEESAVILPDVYFRKQAKLGGWEERGWIADDFDEPMDEYGRFESDPDYRKPVREAWQK
jgi:ATP-dependent DNA helicase RecQ